MNVYSHRQTRRRNCRRRVTFVASPITRGISTNLLNPWWTMCHPHLTRNVCGRYLRRAFSTSSISLLSPSVTMTFTLAMSFPKSRGSATEKTHRNVIFLSFGSIIYATTMYDPFAVQIDAVQRGRASLPEPQVLSIFNTSGISRNCLLDFDVHHAAPINKCCWDSNSRASHSSLYIKRTSSAKSTKLRTTGAAPQMLSSLKTSLNQQQPQIQSWPPRYNSWVQPLFSTFKPPKL